MRGGEWYVFRDGPFAEMHAYYGWGTSTRRWSGSRTESGHLLHRFPAVLRVAGVRSCWRWDFLMGLLSHWEG